MDTLVLPSGDDPVWRLASAGKGRYPEGWLRLGDPVAWGSSSSRSFAAAPLRLGIMSLGNLQLAVPLWAGGGHGGISAVERLLLGYALRIPAYPEGPVQLPLTYRMLLPPQGLRIVIDANTVDPE